MDADKGTLTAERAEDAEKTDELLATDERRSPVANAMGDKWTPTDAEKIPRRRPQS